MLDPREHKGRKDCKVMQGLRVSRVHRGCRVFKVMQDLKALRGLKEFKDHRVTQGLLELMELTELTARLCSVEPSIPKQATVSTETSTSIPRQILFLVPRLLVPGEQVLRLSDPRELKVRKGHRVNKDCRVSREFKAHREMLEPKDPLGLKDLRVMSGRKDLLELMVLMGRPC